MNATMSWADAMKIFMGGDLGEIYSEEVLEFESVWGDQHIGVLENFAANIVRRYTTTCTRQRWNQWCCTCQCNSFIKLVRKRSRNSC